MRRLLRVRYRLSTDGEPTLYRPPRTNDAALGILFERLVFRALAAEPLQYREIPFVALIRQHPVTGRRRERDRDLQPLGVRRGIIDDRFVAQQVGLDACEPLDERHVHA